MVALVGIATASANLHISDKLVEAIKAKNTEGVVTELHLDGMDVNQPDSKGRLPLMEAVRSRELELVDLLLQSGALAASKDPVSGASPLHVAFQQNLVTISRALLAFGADPSAEDKALKKARSFVPSKEIRDLIAIYDKLGSLGFEDEPGTWVQHKDIGHDSYWFNTETHESRWTAPPSCAWQLVQVQGQPDVYINSVTGQELHHIPPALAWTKIRRAGEYVYFNFKANFTQPEKPQEVPENVMAMIEENLNVHWYNEKTGEFSFSDPALNSQWREVHSAEHDRPFYFNIVTGESEWDAPEDFRWTKEHDDESGEHFYVNALTGESTWEAPLHMAWVRHNTDPFDL